MKALIPALSSAAIDPELSRLARFCRWLGLDAAPAAGEVRVRVGLNGRGGWSLYPANEAAENLLCVDDADVERIFRGAYDYNVTKKGRLYPARTVGEAIENIPAKHFKEAELFVKTRTPVLVLRTDNEIPKE